MDVQCRRFAWMTVLLAIWWAVPSSAALNDTLRPLSCVSATALAGCITTPGIDGVGQPAIAPDGSELFVPGPDAATLVAYTVDAATGALSPAGCARADTTNGCVAIPGLVRPYAAAVSPDGAYLYVVSFVAGSGADTLVAIQRQGPGFGSSLCFASSATTGCTTVPALSGTSSVFARNDSIYVTGGGDTGNAVAAFRRDPVGSFTYVNCVGTTAGAGCLSDGGRLNTPTDVVVTPDGTHVYVSDYNYPADVLVGLSRDGNGALSLNSATSSCVGTAPAAGTKGCGSAVGLRETISVALSPDGTKLYASSQYQYGGGDALTAFDVHSDGSLAQIGCWSSSLVTTPPPGCTKTLGAEAVQDVAVTPDGQAVFAASRDGTDEIGSADDGYLIAFSRDAGGVLTQQTFPYGCLSTATIAGCDQLTNGLSFYHVVVSPDGRHLYAAAKPDFASSAPTRIGVFRIDQAPICSPVSTSTPYNTAVSIHLSCTDSDGDPLSYSIVSQPQHGFVGTVQGDNVPYAPFGGQTGQDTFTYRATAAGIDSDPATATVTIGALTSSAPGGSGGGTGGPRMITSEVANVWSAHRTFTIAVQLLIRNVPAGGAVQLRCSAPKKVRRGCPFKRRSVPVKGGKANALTVVKKKRFRVGATLEVRITAPNMIGKVVRFTMRRSKLPKAVRLCLRPGAAKPTAC